MKKKLLKQSGPITDASRMLEMTGTETSKFVDNYCQCVRSKAGMVLFLDIMGFKDKVMRTPHDELEEQLREFKSRHIKLKPLLDKDFIMVQFSDSIIVMSPKANIIVMNRMVKIACILMQEGLKTGFALKGAIAVGNLTFDVENQLYFGQALVDAYLLEEDVKYYGVAFHHTAERLVKDALVKTTNKIEVGRRMYFPVHNVLVPLHKSKSMHYVVLWHRISRHLDPGDVTDDANKWLDELSMTVSGEPRVYIDNSREIIRRSNEILAEEEAEALVVENLASDVWEREVKDVVNLEIKPKGYPVRTKNRFDERNADYHGDKAKRGSKYHKHKDKKFKETGKKKRQNHKFKS